MATFDASAPRQDFTLTEGDDDTFTVTYEDADGNAQDITGWTFWLTVKESITDADSDAVIQKEVTSHTDPTNGQTEFVVTQSDTADLRGNYDYDMQRRDGNGDIVTFATGRLTFEREVTEAT